MDDATNVQRPLPVIDVESRPFWEAASRHELQVQQCRDCSAHNFYPRSLCPTCGSDALEWVAVSGSGVIHSYTIARRAPHPALEQYVPYAVALVDLAEGPRMLTNILVEDPESIRIGDQVTVEFVDVTDDVSLPMFRPACLSAPRSRESTRA